MKTNRSIQPCDLFLRLFQQSLSTPVLPGQVNLGEVLSALCSAGVRPWIVGGAPRHWVQGKQANDIDLVVSHSIVELEEILGKAFPESGTSIIKIPELGLILWGTRECHLDLIRLRVPPATEDIQSATDLFRYPFQFTESIHEDFLLRDFAMNCLYFDPARMELYDPSGRGISDTRQQLLTMVHPTHILEKDRSLVIRAAKFVFFGYTPDKDVVRLLNERLEQDIEYLPTDYLTRWLYNQISGRGSVVTERFILWMKDKMRFENSRNKIDEVHQKVREMRKEIG